MAKGILARRDRPGGNQRLMKYRSTNPPSSSVIAPSAHPGYSATNLQSTGPTGPMKLLYKFTNLFAQSAAAGAAPIALAAAGTEARNGAYYGPTSLGDTRGPVGESTIAAAAQDTTAAKRLWSLSEELLNISFAIPGEPI